MTYIPLCRYKTICHANTNLDSTYAYKVLSLPPKLDAVILSYDMLELR